PRRRPVHSRHDAVSLRAAVHGADPFATRIPVTVLTGFLGSGKTTLLRALLRHPSDLADWHAVDRLKNRLAAINAYALPAIQGELEPRVLADIAPRSIRARPEELEWWLDAAGHGVGAIQATHSHGDVDSGIRSFCLWFDAPLTWRSLGAALDALAALRGADLLRIKGIVHVAGAPGPIVVQGAQHVMHPPVCLDVHDDIEPRSRIVFIVRNIERAAIEALFAAVGALAR